MEIYRNLLNWIKRKPFGFFLCLYSVWDGGVEDWGSWVGLSLVVRARPPICLSTLMMASVPPVPVPTLLVVVSGASVSVLVVVISTRSPMSSPTLTELLLRVLTLAVRGTPVKLVVLILVFFHRLDCKRID